MNPEIEFKVNKEFEKEVAMYFLETNMFDSFIGDFPRLKKAKDLDKEKAKEFLSEEIDKIYEIMETKLLKKKKEIGIKWNEVKDNFFLETEKIFNHKWPKEKYVANVSTFNMFRLKPELREFSIPSYDYAGNPPSLGYINFVICHEMVHILFEDFFNNNFKDSNLPREKYYDLWEIVTGIVLNLPQIIKITKWKNYPYDKHKEDYEHLNNIYKDCKNMKDFVEKSIGYIGGLKE